MWDRITDSSILFKKECHNNNNFYTNTVFINRLYFYYINKGYNNIILSQIINIVISNFKIWFIIFLINVIDYKKIIGVEDYIFIDDVVNAFYAAITSKEISSGVYNLGSGTSTTVLDICRYAEQIILGTELYTQKLERGTKNSTVDNNFWAGIDATKKKIVQCT